MLNEKWRKLKITVVAVSALAATTGAGIWAASYAARMRGYAAEGSEGIFALLAGATAGIIAYAILDGIEKKMVARIISANETKKAEEALRIRKARMFTVGDPAARRRESFTMYSIGEGR